MLIMGLIGVKNAKSNPNKGGIKGNYATVGAAMAYSQALSALTYGLLDGFVASNKVGTSDNDTGHEEEDEASKETTAKRKKAREKEERRRKRAVTMAIAGAAIGIIAARALRAGTSSVLRKIAIGVASMYFLTAAVSMADEEREDDHNDDNTHTSGDSDFGNTLGFSNHSVKMGNLVRKKHKLRSFFAKLEALAKASQSQAEYTSSLAEELGYSTAGLGFSQGLARMRNLSKSVDEKILDNRFAMLRKFVARKNEIQKSRKAMFLAVLKCTDL